MRWLEVLDVEVARPKDRKRVVELCSKISVPQSATLTLYEDSVGNEFTIHIQWRSRLITSGGRSELGRELSSSLSDHGLVTHTLWVEANHSNPGEQPDNPVPQEGTP